MNALSVDLRDVPRSAPGDISGLQERLGQLIGEPFRFFRVSYGDEATLHFGDLHPARSQKLQGKLYGAYILGLRASSWLFKREYGTGSMLVNAGINVLGLNRLSEASLPNEAFESMDLVQAGSRVTGATVFPMKPHEAFALHLQMSDGSVLVVMPTELAPDEKSSDDPEDMELPEIADWELITPGGLLEVGPGCTWSFKTSSTSGPSLPKEACGQ
jgi:hypothetical protein